MLESELFESLEGTTDGAFSVSQQGEILSWNGRPNGCLGLPLPRFLATAATRYCADGMLLGLK